MSGRMKQMWLTITGQIVALCKVVKDPSIVRTKDDRFVVRDLSMAQLHYLCIAKRPCSSAMNLKGDFVIPLIKAAEVRFGIFSNEASPRSGKFLSELPNYRLVKLDHGIAASGFNFHS